LRCIKGSDAAEPNAHGAVAVQGTTGEAVTTAASLRIWAGKAGDPFWIEPDVLHAVGHAFQDGVTFSDADLARAQLIQDLKNDRGVNDEGWESF
jgi:hypothetical protein